MKKRIFVLLMFAAVALTFYGNAQKVSALTYYETAQTEIDLFNVRTSGTFVPLSNGEFGTAEEIHIGQQSQIDYGYRSYYYGAHLYGNIEGNNDVDVYYFLVEESKDAYITLSHSSVYNFSIKLYNESSRSYSNMISYEATQIGGDENNSTLDTINLPLNPGRYFIEVESNSNFTGLGSYQLHINLNTPEVKEYDLRDYLGNGSKKTENGLGVPEYPSTIDGLYFYAPQVVGNIHSPRISYSYYNCPSCTPAIQSNVNSYTTSHTVDDRNLDQNIDSGNLYLNTYGSSFTTDTVFFTDPDSVLLMHYLMFAFSDQLENGVGDAQEKFDTYDYILDTTQTATGIGMKFTKIAEPASTLVSIGIDGGFTVAKVALENYKDDYLEDLYEKVQGSSPTGLSDGAIDQTVTSTLGYNTSITTALENKLNEIEDLTPYILYVSRMMKQMTYQQFLGNTNDFVSNHLMDLNQFMEVNDHVALKIEQQNCSYSTSGVSCTPFLSVDGSDNSNDGDADPYNAINDDVPTADLTSISTFNDPYFGNSTYHMSVLVMESKDEIAPKLVNGNDLEYAEKEITNFNINVSSRNSSYDIYDYFSSNNILIMDNNRIYNDQITVSGNLLTFDWTSPGTYSRSITLTDKEDKARSYTFNITITDNAPVISTTRTYYSVFQGTSQLSDSTLKARYGVTATDDIGVVSITVDSSSINWNRSGIYTVIFRATDTSGHITSKYVSFEIKYRDFSRLEF